MDVLAGLTTAPLSDEPEPDGASEPLPDAPDDADASAVSPDDAPREGTLPEDTLPEDTLPDEALPEDTLPDEALPGDVLQDETPAAPPPVDAVAQPGRPRGAPDPPPRGVILNAEIAAARRDRRLLVFALVTVADAETVVRRGPDDVVRAEAALRQRLSAAPAVRRVEPFGDLLFGVFLDAEGPEVVAWAERVSAAGPPLLVGAVPASASADAVRATATAALQSAYERELVCVLAA